MIERLNPEPQFAPLVDIARARQRVNNSLFDDGHVELHVTQPTAFVFTGDWHLGAPGTNYTRFEEDTYHLAAARATLGERLFIIGMGDYIDGYLPSGTPRNPYQVLDPGEQRLIAEEAFRLIQPNLLIEGDHDLWHSQQALQHTWVYNYTLNKNIYYAQWGTRLTLHTGGTQQTWLVRHRYPGSRAQHPTGPHKRLVSELGPATLAALAHTHSYPGVHRAYSMRRSEGAFHAVQSGTYKQYDEYGKKLAAYEGEYGVPAVVVNPDGSVVPFDRYEDALRFVG